MDLIKLEDSKINEIQDSIINWYKEIRTDEEIENNYFVVSLSKDIESVVFEEVEHDVINSLKNDSDYNDLESEEDKNYYIKENKEDRFEELYSSETSRIYSNIVNHYENIGYEVYHGRCCSFYPINGTNKNLDSESVAFIK